MKIKELLNEDAPVYSHQMFDSLTPFEIGILKRIADDQIDPLTPKNERVAAVIDSLMDKGLLDHSYGLTPAAEKVVNVAASKKLTPYDIRDAKRKAAARRAMVSKGKTDVSLPAVELDDEGGADDLEDDDGSEDLVAAHLAAVAKKKKRRRAVEPLRGRDEDLTFNSRMNDDGDFDLD
jgi:hypothetical protein